MEEQIIQIMIKEWMLPEEMVRQFMVELMAEKPGSLEGLREAASDLLQTMILEKD
jgi:hypothetical protein